MTELTIHIPGEIRPKARIRAKGCQYFMDAKTRNMEAWVKHCAIQSVGKPMLETALSLRVVVTVAIPDSWSARKKERALNGELRPTGRPDASNTLKLLEDALNKLVWKDDSQLVDIAVSKVYGIEPGAVMTVRLI